MIGHLMAAIRRRFCSHTVRVREIARQPDGMVAAPCARCGMRLRADYGLALKATLVGDDWKA